MNGSLRRCGFDPFRQGDAFLLSWIQIVEPLVWLGAERLHLQPDRNLSEPQPYRVRRFGILQFRRDRRRDQDAAEKMRKQVLVLNEH
jgi:hypothetical protein